VVLGLVQVLLQSFLARGEHILDALAQQIPDLDALVLRVLQLMLGYLD